MSFWSVPILLLVLATSYAQDEACVASPSSLESLKDIIDCYSPNAKTKISDEKKQYFAGILAKGEAAPLNDFLKLWNEDTKEYQEDPYFFACQTYAWGALDIFEQKGEKRILPEKCRPDVLYSWADDIKVKNIAHHLADNKKWKGIPNPYKVEKKLIQDPLSLAQTPAMTFGYGQILMRVRIKETGKFVRLTEREQPVKGEIETSPAGYMPEFSLSDSSLVESWSFGTPEIYDEIIRDLIRIQSNKRAQHYFGDEERDGLEKIYLDALLDDHEFSEKVLKRNLLRLIDQILKGEGKVFYQKGACRSYENHYRTKKPTWFNPQ